MKKKDPSLNLKNLFSQNTHEFCKNTSLHGLKYIVSKELNPMERTFFALSFAVVLLASGFYILNVFNKWKTTPVIFVINPKPMYIKQEAFPAVTICNLNQASKDKAMLYSKSSIEYAMIQLLCKRRVNVSIADTITNWNKLDRFIMNISQSCKDMLLSCRFGAVTFNCSDFFHRIITDEGLCCVFNMVHAKFMYSTKYPWYLNKTFPNDYKPVAWSVEDGYPTDLPKHYVPRTAAGTGESLGLSVTLDVDVESYYCSSSNSVGFKIGLHSPTDTPHMRETGLLLPPGKETKVRIRAEKIETEPALRSMERALRQCLFQDEEQLQNFNYYTQRNCESECYAALLADNCGCIGYYMPVMNGISNTCSIYDMSCVARVRFANVDRDVCEHCLPSCFDLSFTPDFFSTPLSHEGFGITSDVVKNISSLYAEKNIAIVHIYFKEKLYRSSKRSEFISFTDFLSSVGGLMGLFMGFSFISLAEFFYYAILRPHRSVQDKRRIAARNIFQNIPKRFGKKVDSAIHRKFGLAGRRRTKQEQLSKNILNSISMQLNQKNMQVVMMKSEFLDKTAFKKHKSHYENSNHDAIKY